VVSLDAGKTQTRPAELICRVLQDPSAWKIGSQIDKHLPQSLGYEHFPDQLMDPVKSQTTGSQIVLQLVASRG
jgi:hypothetical protein